MRKVAIESSVEWVTGCLDGAYPRAVRGFLCLSRHNDKGGARGQGLILRLPGSSCRTLARVRIELF